MPAEAIKSPRRAARFAKLAPQFHHLLASTLRCRTNFRAKLDDRLVHLRFDVFLQGDLAVVENLLNVGTQLARFRIDDLEFLFDPEGEYVC